MIKRLTLVDFMAHAKTVFDFAPGLNVLTGPNNTGKSAVVEALRCLAENPPPSHVIRHGAAEARVTVELGDGTTVAWVRRPKYALYEVARPGAAEPEVYAKFGRTPPEDVRVLLGLGPVTLEGGEEVDVHIGNQREPVFLLNKPGSAVAGFFAASSEAAHLIAMQNLLTDRVRKGKMEKGRLEKRLVVLVQGLDRLAPLPDLELRLDRAAALEDGVLRREREGQALEGVLAEGVRLRGCHDRLMRARGFLETLAAPPVLAPTEPLAQVLGRSLATARAVRRAAARVQVLTALAAPPQLADTTALSRDAVALERLRARRRLRRNRGEALDRLALPPQLADVAALSGFCDRLAGCRDALGALTRTRQGLGRLRPPPPTTDTAPLAALAEALQATRSRLAAARQALAAREDALKELAGGIEQRLRELGVCPLCGGRLSAEDFLGGSHGHGQEGAP